MCELLGLCFSKPLEPRISFLGFRRRGEVNRHGWGVAFYPDRSVQVIKEPIKAGASDLARFLRGYKHMGSKIFMSHVRHATVGRTTRMNTHPFQRELGGRDYVFAHNGDLHGDFRKALPLGAYHPVGDTDSEHAFCHLMEKIRKRKVSSWSRADCRWLQGQLRNINRHGVLNCLLSNGGRLFAYRCATGKRTLFFLNRTPPYAPVRLIDRDFSIDFGKEHPDAQGFVVATRPLTDEPWIPLAPGHMLAFKDGRVVFSDTTMPKSLRNDPLR